MGFLTWILFGFLVGLLARAILPGTQRLGIIATTVLGMSGSVLGGAVGSRFMRHRGHQPAGWIGSVLGAIVVLAVYVIAARHLHASPGGPPDQLSSGGRPLPV